MPLICMDCGNDVIECGPEPELCGPGAPGKFKKLGNTVLRVERGGLVVQVPVEVHYAHTTNDQGEIGDPIVHIEVDKK